MDDKRHDMKIHFRDVRFHQFVSKNIYSFYLSIAWSCSHLAISFMIIIDETQFLMQITIKDMQKLQQILLKEPIPEEVYYYTYTMKFFVKIHEKALVKLCLPEINLSRILLKTSQVPNLPLRILCIE